MLSTASKTFQLCGSSSFSQDGDDCRLNDLSADQPSRPSWGFSPLSTFPVKNPLRRNKTDNLVFWCNKEDADPHLMLHFIPPLQDSTSWLCNICICHNLFAHVLGSHSMYNHSFTLTLSMDSKATLPDPSACRPEMVRVRNLGWPDCTVAVNDNHIKH